MFSFSGKREDRPPHTLLPNLQRRNSPRSCVDLASTYDEIRHGCHNEDNEDRRQDARGTGAHQFQQTADGALADLRRYLPKISIEMPLPRPRSVICSPSHIRNMVFGH